MHATINNAAELDRLTEKVNLLVTKGIKAECLSLEEEKLLALLAHLIEDYEQKQEMLAEAALEAA